MKQHFKLTTSDDLNDLKITDVIDLDFLQRFQDDFAKGVGLASVTVDVNGTPVTGSELLHSLLHGLYACHRMRRQALR